MERDLGIWHDYARVYAICIYYLIKDDLNVFDTLIICGDEDFNSVKYYLLLLFSDNDFYQKKKILSVYKLREITGNKKLKSYADNIANSYRKRVLKNIQKQQTGIPLNPIKINYRMIYDKWMEIEEKMKVSGE